VYFQCNGAQEICSVLRAEVQDALDSGGFSLTRSSERADYQVVADVEGVEQRTSQQFGTTFAVRTYSIEVSGEARTGEMVAMPAPSSVSFDPQYGSERVRERARLIGADITQRVKAFAQKRGG
jgi:hypothetical protein